MGLLPRALPLTSAVMACLAIAACGSSSSTQLVAPTTSKCELSVTSSLSIVPAAGGSGTVAIDTTRDCTWSVATTAPWISFPSSTSGQGSGAVDFRVGANPAPAARQSVVSINDQQVSIQQAAASCIFTLSPSNLTLGAAGGALAVQVTTLSGCAWTTASGTPWLAVTGGGSASGQATVTAAPNSGPARTGTVTIGGQAATVSQAGASVCAFTISPTSATVPAGGGAVAVQVTTTDGCAWTAATATPWLTVTSGGATSGPVVITAGANAGAARTGTVTVAGQTVSISQAAAAVCAFTISPTSQTVPAVGGVITVSVSAGSGCSWTSSSNAAWVTVAAGASGTGNGVVTLAIAPNTGVQRDATVTIAGQTFTASQAAIVACSYSISPTNQSVPAQGGSVTVRVTSTPGCAWTATSGAPWITVSGAVPGDGNGTVNVAVTANGGDLRTGTATIAGQTLTVTQASGCLFSIAPQSQTFTSDAGTGTVTVTTQAGCSWTASSKDPDWLAITAGSGPGSGVVTYSVTANAKKKDRTGHLTIADQTFEVKQNGGAERNFY